MNIKTVSHGSSNFDNITFLQVTEKLRGRTRDGLNKKLEFEAIPILIGGDKRRRSNGKKRRFRGLRDLKLKVLARAGIRGSDIRGIGDVDGNVEEGLGCGFDERYWGGGEKSSVLLDG